MSFFFVPALRDALQGRPEGRRDGPWEGRDYGDMDRIDRRPRPAPRYPTLSNALKNVGVWWNSFWIVLVQDEGWFPGALVCDPGGGRQRWAKAGEACWMDALLSLRWAQFPGSGAVVDEAGDVCNRSTIGAPSLQGYARKARESH